jgi:hypothetical protein
MKLAALFRWPFWHRLEPSFFSGLPEQIDIANQHRKLPSRPPEKIISPQIWIICSETFDDHEVRGHNWAQHLHRVQGRKKYHSKSRPSLVQSSGHSGQRSSITQWYSGVNSQHYFGFRVQMYDTICKLLPPI